MGKFPEEIRRMPARDWQRLRRLYAKCPFGPVRGDMQAWLVADNVWRGWHGKSKSLTDAVIWFGGKRKRKEKPNPQRGRVGRDWIERLEAAGHKIERRKPGEEQPS